MPFLPIGCIWANEQGLAFSCDHQGRNGGWRSENMNDARNWFGTFEEPMAVFQCPQWRTSLEVSKWPISDVREGPLLADQRSSQTSAPGRLNRPCDQLKPTHSSRSTTGQWEGPYPVQVLLFPHWRRRPRAVRDRRFRPVCANVQREITLWRGKPIGTRCRIRRRRFLNVDRERTVGAEFQVLALRTD